MKLKIDYHLTSGEVASQETSDFASVAEARDRCAQMINTPYAAASLVAPNVTHVVNMANVACIQITLAGDA